MISVILPVIGTKHTATSFDMNMTLVAPIHQVWSEFETYEVSLKTFPGKRECG